MGLLTAGFETGTNGSTVATSDTGNATAFDAVNTSGAGATVTYDNTHAAQGSLAVKFHTSASPGTAPYVEWSTAYGSQTDCGGRAYIYMTAYPGSGVVLAPIRGQNGTSSNAYVVRINHDGTIAIRGNGTTDLATSTNTLTLNQWVRLDFRIHHSGTVGTIDVQLFNTAESTSATETISATNANTLTSSDRVRFGNPGTLASTDFWEDGLAIVTGSKNYAGPMVRNTVAPTVSGSAPVGSTLTAANGTWNGANQTFTYQWTRAGANISAATSSTYQTVTADAFQMVGCTVTCTNSVTGEASSQASSNTIAITPSPSSQYIDYDYSRA